MFWISILLLVLKVTNFISLILLENFHGTVRNLMVLVSFFSYQLENDIPHNQSMTLYHFFLKKKLLFIVVRT